eukprot:1157805-Pelagomonas_calceolata.AAC.6
MCGVGRLWRAACTYGRGAFNQLASCPCINLCCSPVSSLSRSRVDRANCWGQAVPELDCLRHGQTHEIACARRIRKQPVTQVHVPSPCANLQIMNSGKFDCFDPTALVP